MKIYKIPLSRSGSYKTRLPADANPISVDFQGANLVLWYTFDDEKANPDIPFTFHVVETGEHFDKTVFLNSSFVGTAYDRNLVLPYAVHVFSSRNHQP